MDKTYDMIEADEEIDRGFKISRDELSASRKRDKDAEDDRLDKKELKRKQYNEAYNRRYYSTHKSAINARCKEYYAANRESVKKRLQMWRMENAEYCAAYQAAYYDENRQAILAKKKFDYEVEQAYQKIMRELEEEMGQ